MEPSSIQFTTSADDTPIAYRTMGDGPPIVVTHNFTISHMELEWKVPSFRTFYEALADHHRVIRFDPRTSGLSGRGNSGFSFQGMLEDLVAVVRACGLDRYALLATSTMGPVAIRHVADHADEVTHFVLCDPDIAVAENRAHAKYLRQLGMLAATGDSSMESVLWTWIARSRPDEMDAWNTLAQANLANESPADRAHLPEEILRWDARGDIGRIGVPTLVVGSDADEVASVDQSRLAAASIAGARLQMVKGMTAPYLVERATILRALGEFLGWATRSVAPPARGISTIVFTDVVGSTDLVKRLGDERGREALRVVEDLVVAEATDRSGRVVKHMGDGSMLEFESATRALEFARAVQERLAGGDAMLRIGMAAGEPIREGGDLHGAVVVVASRVAGLAGPGEIHISDGVRQLVVGKGFEADDLGPRDLKGFDEPVRVWRLRS